MKQYKIFILLIILPYCISGQIWEPVGQMKNPVAGAYAFENNDNIYIAGGYSDSTQSYVPWIQKYSTFLFVWKLIDEMNFSRYGLSGVQYSDSVYFFGGIQNFGDNYKSLESWGINDSVKILAADSIFNRTFAVTVIKDGKVITIGGNPFPGSTNRIPLIAEYDLESRQTIYTFDSTYSVGFNPEQQMAAVIGNDIFIFGGALIGVSRDIYKYNLTDRTLSKINLQLNEPRAAGVAVVDPSNSNKIHIIGGYNENQMAMNSTEIFTDYGGGNYSIEQGAEMNYSRMLPSGVSVGEEIYVLGGYDENGELVSAIEARSSSLVGINKNEARPAEFNLSQNFPNPFNPATTIRYSIPDAEANFYVSLKVFDVLGNEIRTLVDEYQQSGKYEIKFNGFNLPSGIYIYKISCVSPITGKIFIQTKKMMLLK